MDDVIIEQRAASLIENGKFAEAHELLLPLAKQESEYALMTLGWLYEFGPTSLKNLACAESYYRDAISLGCLEAEFRLGSLLKDLNRHKEAYPIFKKGAEAGHLASMYEFAIIQLERANGVIERTQGMAWLENAAALGHFSAQRKILSINYQNSKSINSKAIILLNIVRLSIEATIVYIKDRYSDRLM